MRTLISGLALVLAVALACAGCGSSSGSSFPKAAAKAAATKALFTVDDFPSGWTSSKDDDDDSTDGDDKAMQKQLSDCLDAPPGLIGSESKESARAKSPEFDAPNDGGSVEEEISISRTSRVDQGFKVLSKSSAPDCFTKVMAQYMQQWQDKSNDASVKAATLGDVQVTHLDLSTYGDDTVGMRVSIPMTVQGQSIAIYLDEVYVRHANAVANVEFESFGSPPADAVHDRFLTLATKRLENMKIPEGTA